MLAKIEIYEEPKKIHEVKHDTIIEMLRDLIEVDYSLHVDNNVDKAKTLLQKVRNTANSIFESLK